MTIFTEWMIANSHYKSARALIYSEFSTKWVWDKKKLLWKKRKNGMSIGRLIYINPTTGELFYLRLLFIVVRGPKSYEEIQTVNGVKYPTF